MPSRADSGDAPIPEPSPAGELVRLLRALEPSALQPGLVDRCWEEFRLLAELPPAPPVAEAVPAPTPAPARAPARLPADLVPPPQDDLRERLGFVRPRRIAPARP